MMRGASGAVGVSRVDRLPAFDAGGHLNVVIETPRGSTIKIKFDRGLGVFTLSRPLPLGVSYPFDWGFVPGTEGPDGDPIDAMIAWEATGYPGLLVSCRPLGVLRVEQNAASGDARQRNDRLIVVPVESPRLQQLTSIDDLSDRARVELEAFFRAAVQFERKDLELLGWAGPAEAEAAVRSAHRETRGSPA
jgi:inorganic pyrophosphatase